MAQPIALAVHTLTVAYDSAPVLQNISLEIPAGSLAAIVGPNGAGKTTFLKAVLGFLKPIAGTVDFPTVTKPHQIAYVPQNSSVDWDFPATVLDVVMMGRYGHLGWCKRPGKNEAILARQALESVGMEAFAKRHISQLSGGQQQRVFLARALVQEAEIYCMDEPFKGVDVQTEATIVSLLKALQQQGKTVIVVHHDLHTVPAYFDWVSLINRTVIANGFVDTVFTKEALQRTYGVAVGGGLWNR